MSIIEDQIADIETWDRSKCLAAWIKLTGCAPGARLSTRFLQRALIFEAQCKAHGGHAAAVKRQLKAVAPMQQAADRTSAATLTAGTQLVREWNGRIYRVDVLADGYVMDGQTYTSLSAVAKRITGTHWSGPRFFGLTENPR